MQRREVLAVAGSIGVGASAGCLGLGSETTISNPAEFRAADGETTLQFQTDGGDEVGSLTIRPGTQRYSGHGGELVPVDVAITHRDGTAIDGLTLGLRAPPGGAGAPAEVALQTPFGTPHPSMDLYAAPDDGGTVLSIDEMGEQGDGTLVLKFLLTGLGVSTTELEVDATVELTSSGVFTQDYTLTGLTLVSLPDGAN